MPVTQTTFDLTTDDQNYASDSRVVGDGTAGTDYLSEPIYFDAPCQIYTQVATAGVSIAMKFLDASGSLVTIDAFMSLGTHTQNGYYSAILSMVPYSDAGNLESLTAEETLGISTGAFLLNHWESPFQVAYYHVINDTETEKTSAIEYTYDDPTKDYDFGFINEATWFPLEIDSTADITTTGSGLSQKPCTAIRGRIGDLSTNSADGTFDRTFSFIQGEQG